MGKSGGKGWGTKEEVCARLGQDYLKVREGGRGYKRERRGGAWVGSSHLAS